MVNVLFSVTIPKADAPVCLCKTVMSFVVSCFLKSQDIAEVIARAKEVSLTETPKMTERKRANCQTLSETGNHQIMPAC